MGQWVGADQAPPAGFGICSQWAENTGKVCVCVSVWLFALIVWRLWCYKEEFSVVPREMLMWQILSSAGFHCRECTSISVLAPVWWHVNGFAAAALDASDSLCGWSWWHKAEVAVVCPRYFKHAWETQGPLMNMTWCRAVSTPSHFCSLMIEGLPLKSPPSTGWLQACSDIFPRYLQSLCWVVQEFLGTLNNTHVNVQVFKTQPQESDWLKVTYTQRRTALLFWKKTLKVKSQISNLYLPNKCLTNETR